MSTRADGSFFSTTFVPNTARGRRPSAASSRLARRCRRRSRAVDAGSCRASGRRRRVQPVVLEVAGDVARLALLARAVEDPDRGALLGERVALVLELRVDLERVATAARIFVDVGQDTVAARVAGGLLGRVARRREHERADVLRVDRARRARPASASSACGMSVRTVALNASTSCGIRGISVRDVGLLAERREDPLLAGARSKSSEPCARPGVDERLGAGHVLDAGRDVDPREAARVAG